MLLLILNFFSALLSSVSWGVTLILSKGLASRPIEGKLRSRAGWVLGIICLSLLMTAVRIYTWVRLGAVDWLFIEDKVFVQFPLILFPVISVFIYSIPIMLNIRKSVEARSKDPISVKWLSSLSSGTFIVPMQATALGALANLLLTLLNPQSPVDFTNVYLTWLVFAVLVAGLWTVQTRKQRKIETGFPKEGKRGLSHILGRVGKWAALISVLSLWFVISAQASRLPDYLSMMAGDMEYGGGTSVIHSMGNQHSSHAGAGSEAKTVSVSELTGPQTGTPDFRFTLTAEKKQIVLASGKKIDAWTFNGLLPGPELRVRQGDLVEITLINRDIDEGVTLHWHGLNVPNGEDGVAGLTQDAVLPGGSHVYRFRANQAGTYWYHSHQSSSEQVKKGLFGVIVVEPARSAGAEEVKDITVARHSWDTPEGSAAAFGSNDTVQRVKAAPGTSVRLRLLNSDDWPKTFYLAGVKYKVASIDGVELNGATEIKNRPILLAAGGRYDVTFAMPDSPVVLTNKPGTVSKVDPALLLSSDGKGSAPLVPAGRVFEPWDYGSAGTTPFGLDSKFDREFVMVLDNKAGFYDGKFSFVFTINGKVFPDTPMFMVREGELIKTKFVNRSFLDHPMHLHGHHMLVLTRNGKPLDGTPWWTDTLNVAPGDTYEVAFRADNPGIWMDHCHNLEHAAVGMTMHLAYEGVTTPYEVGHASVNHPE